MAITEPWHSLLNAAPWAGALATVAGSAVATRWTVHSQRPKVRAEATQIVEESAVKLVQAVQLDYARLQGEQEGLRKQLAEERQASAQERQASAQERQAAATEMRTLQERVGVLESYAVQDAAWHDRYTQQLVHLDPPPTPPVERRGLGGTGDQNP